MRILFICENYLPHYGGAEVLFKNLAERYVQQGHTVSVLTHQMRGTVREEVIKGVRVYRVPSFFSRYMFTFLAIPKALRLARKHDIIQTTTFNGAPPAWLAGKLMNKPVVLTVHEVWIGRWKEITGFSTISCFIHNLLERAIYWLPFDKYICVSEATKNDLRKRGIAAGKVVRIYNGVDYDFWNPATVDKKEIQKLRTRLNLQHKWVYFSWGRPGNSKGFDSLIRAAAKGKELVPRSALVLMFGSVDQYRRKYRELLALIEQLHLQDYVTVVPSVSYPELKHYVAMADTVVVPSLSEGFGYNALEAVSIDTPVIISNAGSLPEVVGGKHLVFKSKDAADLAEKMKEAAAGRWDSSQKKVFLWDRTIKEYLNVYRIVVPDTH